MKTLFIALIALLASAQAHAVDPASWQQLVQKTLAEGTVLQTQMGPTIHLARLSDPEQKASPRHSDYFTLAVTETPAGYVPNNATLVSEDWLLNAEGNWEVNQILFWMRVDGTLVQASRVEILLSPDHILLKYKNTADAVNDPKTIERYELKLAEWFKENGPALAQTHF
jgi:hypothetical protein